MQAPQRQGNPNFQKEYIQFIGEIRKIISNILYQESIFSAIVNEYDKGDPVQVIARSTVRILETVVKQVGALDMPSLFAAGLIIANDIQVDMKATGRKDLTPEQSQEVIPLAVKMYSERHPDEIDQKIAIGMLNEMDSAAKSGELQKMFSQNNQHTQQPQQGLLGA